MATSEIIVPFVESVESLCRTMLGCERVERKRVSLAVPDTHGRELTAFIGLSGPDRGTIALVLPERTALNIASAFLGMEFDTLNEDVTDSVAEVVNIIGGGAKVNLPKADDELFQLGLPTVVQGHDYAITSPAESVWLDIPFETDLGPFTVRVSFESMKKKQHN